MLICNWDGQVVKALTWTPYDRDWALRFCEAHWEEHRDRIIHIYGGRNAVEFWNFANMQVERK